MNKVKTSILLMFSIMVLVWPLFGKSTSSDYVSSYKLNGYLGSRIMQCIDNQVKKQDVTALTDVFRQRSEKKLWQTEFWGKWMLSATAAYKYNPNAELLSMMKKSVDEIIATQSSDGYIGNYAPEYKLQGWDIWGQKYTMLGLLSFYEITKQQQVLKATILLADNLIYQLHSTNTNISKTGKYRGMPSSSVLEPIVKLYTLTDNLKYLNFAKEIVESWELIDGPGLISKSLLGVSVGDRFKTSKIWWSWDNGEKAYEMLSCYDGLLELFKVTKDTTYLKAVENAVQDIIRTEINIVGSGSAMECFYHGTEHQTEPTYHTMETCFTFSWMKLCLNLLKYNKNSFLADQIEKTAYNAMLAALKKDGSEFAKYTSLEGYREEGEQQCGMDINCCNANGPRGLLLIPEWSIMTDNNQIFINGYETAQYRVTLSSKEIVDIQIISEYPLNGDVKIRFSTASKTKFDLQLRIPSWTDKTVIKSGIQKPDTITSPGYFRLSTCCNTNDSVNVEFNMKPRIVRQNGFQAVLKGPIVFARDSRFNDGFVDESVVLSTKNFVLKDVPKSEKSDFWMTVVTKGVFGTNLESDGKNGREVRLCDFVSAGNNWNPNTRYRVWLKETLNVMNTNYVAY